MEIELLAQLEAQRTILWHWFYCFIALVLIVAEPIGMQTKKGKSRQLFLLCVINHNKYEKELIFSKR